MINTHKIILGDCIAGMKTMPDGCVQTCITSPPYWGLRDYGTAIWEGGDDTCDHVEKKKIGLSSGLRNDGRKHKGLYEGEKATEITMQYNGECGKCGAKRIDAQLGAEKTPEEYVENMVKVFREVRRILRNDGTVWLNLGDSYARNGGGVESKMNTIHTMGVGQKATYLAGGMQTINKVPFGLKSKDLVGIPWRVAFALQADGWYLRQDIIWHKPNPMPESVTDRCTKSHEYIFMLSKKSHYYFDHEAIKEKAVGVPHAPGNKNKTQPSEKGARDPALEPDRVWASDGKRNRRSVWTVTTKPFRGAHFATFPKDLIEPCVLAGCPVGGTVFDPFTGSGTTAIVSLKHNRNFIGTELNPEYIKIAEARIKEEVPNTLQEFIQ